MRGKRCEAAANNADPGWLDLQFLSDWEPYLNICLLVPICTLFDRSGISCAVSAGTPCRLGTQGLGVYTGFSSWPHPENRHIDSGQLPNFGPNKG